MSIDLDTEKRISEFFSKKTEKCNATIKFGDDFGDNETTFHCQLKEGHRGEHEECGDMYGKKYALKWILR